jgi:hypothetical protein
VRVFSRFSVAPATCFLLTSSSLLQAQWGGRNQIGGGFVDIEVGDSVMSTGTLKDGVFTVLKMGVSEQGSAGGT